MHWADVGRWANRIHHYRRPPRPGEPHPFGSPETGLARYIASIYSNVHPIFSDTYLDTIEGFPIGHPLNRHTPPPDQDDPSARFLPDGLGVWATVEVVLHGSDGAILDLGVVRSSGVDELDAAALETFARAAPFGPPPPATLSADDALYIERPFFRLLLVACSTVGAHPYLFR